LLRARERGELDLTHLLLLTKPLHLASKLQPIELGPELFADPGVDLGEASELARTKASLAEDELEAFAPRAAVGLARSAP
jgi:hypothetical protein